MSKENPRLHLANLSLWDINPENIAIKNDFQDNLISLAMDVGMHLLQAGIKIRVLKGFSSLQKLNSKVKEPTYLQKRYCSANALHVTWDGFEKDKIKNILRELINVFENNLSFLVHDNSLEVYRSDKRIIEESIEEGSRVFYALAEE